MMNAHCLLQRFRRQCPFLTSKYLLQTFRVHSDFQNKVLDKSILICTRINAAQLVAEHWQPQNSNKVLITVGDFVTGTPESKKVIVYIKKNRNNPRHPYDPNAGQAVLTKILLSLMSHVNCYNVALLKRHALWPILRNYKMLCCIFPISFTLCLYSVFQL